MAFTLDTKRKQRFEFMRCLYEKTEGSEMGLVYVEEIADQIKLPLLETEIIALFLADEGLLRVRMRNIISISHTGIDEVETALGQPDRPTVHFPPLNSGAEHVLSAPPLVPSNHGETPDFTRQLHAAPESLVNLPLKPMPPPLAEKPGEELDLTSICEAIGLDPRAVAGASASAPVPEISDEVHKLLERAHAAAKAPVPAPVPEISDEVHKLLDRAQAAAKAPVPMPPPASVRITRTATARVLQPHATPAPRASEIADLLASLKLRLIKIRLSPDDMGEAQAEIATAIAQLLSPRPKQPVIAASLATLLSVLEGAQAVPLTSDVKRSLAKIGDFLDQL